MLIADLKGRLWWCPELEATFLEEIEFYKIDLTEQDWKEYQGPWNINPGANYDQN